MNSILSHLKYGGVLCTLTIGSGLLFVWPSLRRHAEMEKLVMDLTERTTHAAEDEAEFAAAQERLEELARRFNDELRAIPADGNAPWLHKSISQDIDELPLQLVNLTWGQETPVGSTVSLGINIETMGPFISVYELLRRIEEMPRLVRVHELTLTRLDKSDNLQVNADIRLKAFHQGASGSPERSGRE